MLKKLVYSIFFSTFFLFLIFVEEALANTDIVNYNKIYSYEDLTRDIKQLEKAYPEIITYKSLGKTKYGRDIWAVRLGNGPSPIFINGAHHAREWMTTIINMYMIENYAKSYTSGQLYEGYNVREILDRSTIWFVPMVNPDGVTLQQKGLTAFPKSVHSSLVKMNGGSSDFKRWKANAEGIDLNRQYPAKWETIVNNSPQPSWANHKGAQSLVAIESKIMADFTYEIDPEIAISYHSSGRILYWHFHNLPTNLERDKRLATAFSQKTGYKLVQPMPNPSGGGFTDWFIQEFGKPGFTPEISYSVGDTHVPLALFPEEWNRNKMIGLWAATEGYQLWYGKNKELIASTDNLVVQYNENLDAYKQGLEQLANGNEEISTELEDLSINLSQLKEKVISNLMNLKNYNKAIEIQKAYMKNVDRSTEQYSILGELYEKALDTDIKIFLNGSEVILDIEPILQESRTMVPIRAVSDEMGKDVVWDEANQAITIREGEDELVLFIGRKDLLFNGEEMTMETFPLVREERVFVPLRLINEVFGSEVLWQQKGQIVIINE